MAVCTASAAFMPGVCPGFTPCNPNAIILGDNVTIDLCIENESVEPTQELPPYPPVVAALSADSTIHVFLMCAESLCTSPMLQGITYNSFTPAANVSSSFTLGASFSSTCHLAPEACGVLTLANDVVLPPGQPVCLGMIHASVTALPVPLPRLDPAASP